MVVEAHELCDRLLRSGAEPIVLIGRAEALQQGDPVLFDISINVGHAGVADGAFWRVDDSLQRDDVVRIHQHPQIGERILNLAMSESRRPAFSRAPTSSAM